MKYIDDLVSKILKEKKMKEEKLNQIVAPDKKGEIIQQTEPKNGVLNIFQPISDYKPYMPRNFNGTTSYQPNATNY